MTRISLWLSGLLACGAIQADELAPTQDIFAGLDLPNQAAVQAVTASGALPAVTPVEPVEPGESDGTLPAPPAPPASSAEPTQEDDSDGSLQAVQLYDPEQLIDWINHNTHLQRVKADDCQLVQDIEARAKVMLLPAYQFLWGDMLAWGVCVPKNAEQGVDFMWQAARQGLPAALEQLGRYYAQGTFVQKDPRQAALLMREAASLGLVKAQIAWVRMLVNGLGSPLDYEEAYRWLHHAVIGDAKQHAEASRLLAQLAKRMPANVVRRAKEYR